MGAARIFSIDLGPRIAIDYTSYGPMGGPFGGGRLRRGRMKSGSYCDCALCGVTVSETDTTWLAPVCRAVTRIVPVYVPGVRPVTLAVTNNEAGVVPARGITWSHDALLVANQDTPLAPGVIMVSDCAGGFDSPSATAKLSPVGATVSAVAASAKEAATQRSSATARQRVSLRERLQHDRAANSSRYRIEVSSLPQLLYPQPAGRARDLRFAIAGVRDTVSDRPTDATARACLPGGRQAARPWA